MSETKKNNTALTIILAILAIALVTLVVLLIINGGSFKNLFGSKSEDSGATEYKVTDNQYTAYRLKGNSLEEFDLYFLKLENEKKNKVYSPLSIKYALEMLEEGTNGETKAQISNIIGSYSAKKYDNNANMSFANALFVKDSFKDSIKSSYTSTLSSKYNAEIVYDSFATANGINSWVSDKTLKLINGIATDDDVKDTNFALINALAIDMEWVKQIQPTPGSDFYHYVVSYPHMKYGYSVPLLGAGDDQGDYTELDFTGYSKKAQAVKAGAVINNYDIVNTLGKDEIEKTIRAAYQRYLNNTGEYEYAYHCDTDPDVDTYINTDYKRYLEELNSNYHKYSSSTDFEFYIDDDVKMFAKDLKEYNGTTLQYVGIMPVKESLDSYISKVKASDINSLIGKLKSLKPENFKEGVITELTAVIPTFKFDYKLNLKDDLSKLGITNVFDSEKADLSNLTTNKQYIKDAKHSSNIEFSNDGIKAAAVSYIGGQGGGDCGFDYSFEVPVEKIDLTFNNPYMFIIRDKKTGEVWFTGTVYEPSEYSSVFENCGASGRGCTLKG